MLPPLKANLALTDYTLSFHDVINTWNAELNAEMLVCLLGQLYNVLTKPSKQQTLS